MPDDTAPAWAPDSCTLPTADRPTRQAEFDAVFATALERERVDERHLRYVLDVPPDDLRDLAARENECCSFFTFTVTPRAGGGVIFDVEVPASHVAVLDALAEVGP